MLYNLKALVVVLAIAMVVFALAKPFILRFVDAPDFVRRRNIWLVLTVSSFVCQSIWLYALIALPLMYFGAKKDRNPLAFYVWIAFCVPNSSIQIPTVGIGQLLELSQLRMMALVILLPMVFRFRFARFGGTVPVWTTMDTLILGLGLLQVGLAFPYDTFTNSLRRLVVYFLDTFLVFYVFARAGATRETIREVLASFVLVGAVLAALASFESFRGWLLYISIGAVWGAFDPFSAYLLRSGLLRAQATLGHSLLLGYVASVVLTLWFFVSEKEPRMLRKVFAVLLLCLGVFVTGSRGAWITAFIGFSTYIMLRPDAGRYLAKALPILAIAFAVAYATPLKESFIDKLPIIGNSDQDTVEYRQQIAEVSWRLIRQNPFFGDPFALRNMEELRQGQGIIDLVNGYANVAVFSGGVGFFLFVIPFVIALTKTFAHMKKFRQTDKEFASMGAVLIASLLASLFFIGTAAIHPVTYWLTGLMMTYTGVAAVAQRRGVLPVVPFGGLGRQISSQ